MYQGARVTIMIDDGVYQRGILITHLGDGLWEIDLDRVGICVIHAQDILLENC